MSKKVSKKAANRIPFKHNRSFYKLKVKVNGKVAKYVIIYQPLFDFRGNTWKRIIHQLSDLLKVFDINTAEIEEAIIVASKHANVKPPKYLRGKEAN